jgi:signal transduction histidine kinase
MIGRKREEVVPLTFAKKLSAARHKAMLTGDSTQVEDRVPTVNGKRWYSLIFVPLRNASGEITSVMGISRDIHDQKKLELALKRSKSMLEKRVSERTRELLASQEQLHRLTQKIVTDQEDLFRHASRELHDEAGQALIALKFNLTTVLEELPANASNMRSRISDSIELLKAMKRCTPTPNISYGCCRIHKPDGIL